MPLFYRGAGIGTYWHVNDPRMTGFVARAPTIPSTVDRVMTHIAQQTTASPYVSLTRSFGVARDYAQNYSKVTPTPDDPAFVWEIEFDDGLPDGLTLLDPVKVLAGELPEPYDGVSYCHDGPQSFLLGLVDPLGHAKHLTEAKPTPPGSNWMPAAPRLSGQLQTLVFALRDAEVLAHGPIGARYIKARHTLPPS